MLELREGTSLHFIAPPPPPENPLSLAGFQAGLLSLMPCITPSFAAGIERKHHQNATRRIGRKRMIKVSRETTTFIPTTLPKTNMDTRNDGLEKVSPFKNGHFWYQFVRFLGCTTISKLIFLRRGGDQETLQGAHRKSRQSGGWFLWVVYWEIEVGKTHWGFLAKFVSILLNELQKKTRHVRMEMWEWVFFKQKT